MSETKSYKGVIKRFDALPLEIRRYLAHTPSLIRDYPWEIPLAYIFSRVEFAHNMTIYCGVVKLHKANAEVTRNAVNSLHMTRKYFHELAKTIYGTPIPPVARDRLANAEKVRDKALHGKSVTPGEYREAVENLFKYSIDLNAFCEDTAGFKPFSDLRGFKGRGQSLDKSTTRWLLKGIGVLS